MHVLSGFEIHILNLQFACNFWDLHVKIFWTCNLACWKCLAYSRNTEATVPLFDKDCHQSSVGVRNNQIGFAANLHADYMWISFQNFKFCLYFYAPISVREMWQNGQNSYPSWAAKFGKGRNGGCWQEHYSIDEVTFCM